MTDADFTPLWARATVLPLLTDASALTAMGEAARGAGGTDAAAKVVALIEAAAAAAPASGQAGSR